VLLDVIVLRVSSIMVILVLVVPITVLPVKTEKNVSNVMILEKMLHIVIVQLDIMILVKPNVKCVVLNVILVIETISVPLVIIHP